jgi:hypothetical protein
MFQHHRESHESPCWKNFFYKIADVHSTNGAIGFSTVTLLHLPEPTFKQDQHLKHSKHSKLFFVFRAECEVFRQDYLLRGTVRDVERDTVGKIRNSRKSSLLANPSNRFRYMSDYKYFGTIPGPCTMSMERAVYLQLSGHLSE